MSAVTPIATKSPTSRERRDVPKADIVPQKKDRLAAVSPDFNLRVMRAEVFKSIYAAV
jgi:hypothetical protein